MSENRTPMKNKLDLIQPDMVHTLLCTESGTDSGPVSTLPVQRGKRFIKPTIDDIVLYMGQIGIPTAALEACKFYDFYESKGWKVGKSPMIDWKAAARNWGRNVRPQNRPAGGNF